MCRSERKHTHEQVTVKIIVKVTVCDGVRAQAQLYESEFKSQSQDKSAVYHGRYQQCLTSRLKIEHQHNGPRTNTSKGSTMASTYRLGGAQMQACD